MCQSNARNLEPLRCPREKIMTRLPCRHLNRERIRPTKTTHIETFDDYLHTQTFPCATHQALARVAASAPELMIQMSDGQPPIIAFGSRVHRTKQGHRAQAS